MPYICYVALFIMKNIWRWLCWPIDIIAIIILQEIGLTWWLAALIVLVPAFLNYMDGLWRGRNS